MPTPPPPEHSRFKPGQSGNPSGKHTSRKQLEREFLEDLHASWKEGGKDAIKRVMEKKPQDYLKVVAGLLPKQIDVNDTGSLDRERATKLLELVNRRLEELSGVPAGGEVAPGVGESAPGLSAIPEATRLS